LDSGDLLAPPASPRRGEVWYVHLPGQPRDPHQPRPALVVSTDLRHRLRDDLIVVPIFSRGALGPTRVLIREGQGGVPRDGVLFCDQLATIDRSFLADGPLGTLVPPELLDRVVRAVRRALGEVVVEESPNGGL
jgi:mRNA-degrading endonuclease toxin of MazEF toxin-antitoxin module